MSLKDGSATYAAVPATPTSDDRVEVEMDLSSQAPPAAHDAEAEVDDTPAAMQKVINVSVTNGGAVQHTFPFTCTEEDMSIVDLKQAFEATLAKLDEPCKLRMLIFRGQIMQNGKNLSDYKLDNGDTLQLLTWVPEAAAAAAAAAQTQAEPPRPSPIISRSDFSIEVPQRPFGAFPAAAPASQAGLELQEEVERWAARVKVWTCMLLLLYSFVLLVSMSQSLEANQRHSSQLAFNFLAFWVAYIGLRAATRLNFSLARGYYYGQITVALCKIFLMAIRDPTEMPSGTTTDEAGNEHEISPNMLYIWFGIRVIVWAYIVYGAYRFQRALHLWLQDGAPDHIVDAQEEV